MILPSQRHLWWIWSIQLLSLWSPYSGSSTEPRAPSENARRPHILPQVKVRHLQKEFRRKKSNHLRGGLKLVFGVQNTLDLQSFKQIYFFGLSLPLQTWKSSNTIASSKSISSIPSISFDVTPSTTLCLRKIAALKLPFKENSWHKGNDHLQWIWQTIRPQIAWKQSPQLIHSSKLAPIVWKFCKYWISLGKKAKLKIANNQSRVSKNSYLMSPHVWERYQSSAQFRQNFLLKRDLTI